MVYVTNIFIMRTAVQTTVAFRQRLFTPKVTMACSAFNISCSHMGLRGGQGDRCKVLITSRARGGGGVGDSTPAKWLSLAGDVDTENLVSCRFLYQHPKKIYEFWVGNF